MVLVVVSAEVVGYAHDPDPPGHLRPGVARDAIVPFQYPGEFARILNKIKGEVDIAHHRRRFLCVLDIAMRELAHRRYQVAIEECCQGPQHLIIENVIQCGDEEILRTFDAPPCLVKVLGQ